MTTWSRADYHGFKASGICVQCGRRQAVPGMTCCDPCAEARAERHRRSAARAIEAGCCPRHRSSPIVPGWKCCILCIAHERRRKQKTKTPKENRP